MVLDISGAGMMTPSCVEHCTSTRSNSNEVEVVSFEDGNAVTYCDVIEGHNAFNQSTPACECTIIVAGGVLLSVLMVIGVVHAPILEVTHDTWS